MKDPIITELRKIRDAHAAKFNYNFDAIAQGLSAALPKRIEATSLQAFPL